MEKSALQLARAAYQPKLPKALQGAVKVKEGCSHTECWRPGERSRSSSQTLTVCLS